MRRLSVLTAAALLTSCRDSPPPSTAAPAPALRFTDVTAESGIDFTTTNGRADAQIIAEVKGGGLALIDVDGDGDLDVFVPNGRVPAGAQAPRPAGSRVFRNDGALRFTDVTAETGIDFDGWGMGVAVGDVDGDGDLDLYVTGYVDLDLEKPPPLSTFRGHPVPAGPRGLPAAPDRLYLNRGDGTFEDATDASGVGAVEPAYGLGVVILDMDDDHGPEIFVGNDSVPNFLFRNLGDGRFEEVGLGRGIATASDGSSRATMGIAIGDVDGDGRQDVFTTNFAGEPNTLHANRPGLFFDEVTRRYALGLVGFAELGWAATFADFDHDGDEDLLFLNGHVYPGATAAEMFSDYAQAPILLAREGDRFRRLDAAESGSWLEVTRCDRSMVTGDLDGDGDLDVITSGLNEPLRVLRNDGAAGRWLIVAPEGPLGTTVIVERGDETWHRVIASGAGYLSSSEPVAHFGLGADDSPLRVTVIWPNNDRFSTGGVTPDQRLVVRRPR